MFMVISVMTDLKIFDIGVRQPFRLPLPFADNHWFLPSAV